MKIACCSCLKPRHSCPDVPSDQTFLARQASGQIFAWVDVRKLLDNSSKQLRTPCADWPFALSAWFVVTSCDVRPWVMHVWRLPLHFIRHHKLANHQVLLIVAIHALLGTEYRTSDPP
jgi:hypothetical protein